MKIKPATQRRLLGISLFELLMTLALLGVMSSIAVAAFGNQSDAFRDARDRRNAKELANVCTAAKAAGLDFVVAGQLAETVRKVVTGAAPTRGLLKGRIFKVNLIAEADINGASRFLEIQNGELLYRHDS